MFKKAFTAASALGRALTVSTQVNRKSQRSGTISGIAHTSEFGSVASCAMLR